MSRTVRSAVAAALLSGLLLTSCAPKHSATHDGAPSSGRGGSSGNSASGGGRSGGPLPLGPGPQPAYRVQRQPPAGSCHYRYSPDKEPLPDPTCTPGALNPKVTQATLDSTICRKGGYTSDIRPPTNITNREKAANAKSYGYTGNMRDAEYDHLVSLQLGGDPNDPRNLWVEPPSPGHRPNSGPNNDKDAVETSLHTAVCKKQVTLEAAQRAIAGDWTTALAGLGLGRK
ncbi:MULTISPECIES: hypothetical protein [Streptomycetaceae]|uniref:HNH endonuclease n=1 Tax=Streptantibioticus cattleyicolor (strain ATCC 35852 / DSM 46488 / JCM 4925 / NBRC 14057 / NRRL 8057) TaxID=1003195 RepID=F8JPI6_STREN|nr:hypothetical protein [Streptantibioticus cattleyicolor]AEW97755.1 hypothetical protein SCATT_53840 [Streptantibioticus cattleyicolor NRRL 8057 = DSM 46488]MYS62177.1 hypothetical protein [Streptomyces sp. SID5468]CCB78073.1 conserved exported protein of unknown function [Streptantibioticus cattleyicolor NRRL 8057 = DSM 46488]